MKCKTINTVTAKALAGQIITEIEQGRIDKNRKSLEAAKKSSKIKTLQTLVDKKADLNSKIESLRNDLQRELNVEVSTYGAKVSISSLRPSKVDLCRDDLADQIIIAHNVHGKDLKVIQKEMITKLSK